jgi:cytochrome P450
MEKSQMTAVPMSEGAAAGLSFRGAPVSQLDPFTSEYFEDPFAIQDKFRETGSVIWLDTYRCWAVARYAEVHAALRDWQTFCSSRGVGLSDFAKEQPWRPKSLVLETDPPEHDRARAILNRVISPAVMKQLRESFMESADRMIEALLERRQIDVVPDLAEAYPLAVFPDALGMPKEGREHVIPYASSAFNAFGPDNDIRRKAIADSAPHAAWVNDSCQRDRLSVHGFGAQIHGAVDTGELTAQEAPLLVRSLFTAGVDTTVAAIGGAVHCLARFPEQFAKLRADPSLARAAFEEAVRFESPVQLLFRTTTRQVRLGAIELQEGEKIMLLLGAANRDPRNWERPEQYDITRRASGHVGFGNGVHSCAGQVLARLEGEAVLGALARKVQAIEMTALAKRRHNNTLRLLESLPVRLHPHPASELT